MRLTLFNICVFTRNFARSNVLWPSYKSAWVNQHRQLRTGEDFVGAKFYCLTALADGKQRIQVREKMLEFLLSVTCTTHTHPFNNPFSGTTQVSRYQEGKTNLDFTEARDSEWQWHQLGRMHCIWPS